MAMPAMPGPGFVVIKTKFVLGRFEGDGLLLAPGIEHVIGRNTQNIAFARIAQQSFDLSRAIHAVRHNERERHLCGDCASDHATRDFRLRRKAYIARHMRCLQANAVVRPFLWQVERTVDEGMAMPRHIASEYANLAIGDFCLPSQCTDVPPRTTTYPASKSRSRRSPEPRLHRKAFPVRTLVRRRVARRHPIVPAQGLPAGATGLDHRPPPLSSNPSYAPRCSTVHRETVQPRSRPDPA